MLYFNVINQQLKTMLDEGVTIIDIRRPEEWKQTGVVKGSQRLTSLTKAAPGTEFSTDIHTEYS